MRTFPSKWAPLALVGAVMLMSGCHTYRTVQTPEVGSEVRVRVPVTSALASPNAPQQTAGVEGRLLGVGDTLLLATQTRRELGAFRELTQFDTLRLAANQMTSIEVKEFSTTRSVILGATIAAVAGVAAVLAFNGPSGSKGTPSPGPDSPDTSIVASSSLVSFLWGLLGG